MNFILGRNTIGKVKKQLTRQRGSFQVSDKGLAFLIYKELL